MSRLLTLLALLLPLAAAAQDSRDARPAGYVAEAVGDARAHGAAPADPGRPLRAGDPIRVGERLATSADGTLRVVLYDDSVIAIGHEATASVQGFAFDRLTGRGKIGVELAAGALTMTPGRVGSADPANVTLKMPGGAVVAAGASFAARVDGARSLVAMLDPGPAVIVGGPRVAVVGGDSGSPVVMRESGAAVEIGRFGGVSTLPRIDPPRAARLLAALPYAAPELAAIAREAKPARSGVLNRVLDRLGATGEIIRGALGLDDDAVTEPESNVAVAEPAASFAATPAGAASDASRSGEQDGVSADAAVAAPGGPTGFDLVRQVAIIVIGGTALVAICAMMFKRVRMVFSRRRKKDQTEVAPVPQAGGNAAAGASSAGRSPSRGAPIPVPPAPVKLVRRFFVQKPEAPPRVSILTRNAPPRYTPLTADPTFGPKLRRR